MPAYAGNGVENFEICILRGLSALVKSIRERYAGTGTLMHLTTQVHFATMDTLGELAYSRPLGILAKNKDQGDFLKINKSTLPLLLTLSSYTGFWRLMQCWPFNYMILLEGDPVGLGVLIGSSHNVSSATESNGTPNPIETCCRCSSTTAWTETTSWQNFAGSDASANTITITITILHLLQNSLAHLRLRQELDDAATSSLITHPRPPTPS